jgi:hypothetical protein
MGEILLQIIGSQLRVARFKAYGTFWPATLESY